MQLLPKEFYLDNDVVRVARSLIGCVLQSRKDGQRTSGIIVETEAYRGRDDKGCHAFIHGNKGRTRTMFEEGGCAYVYICYGMHHMVNVVTNSAGHGDAVLIRAIQPLEGLDIMQHRRKMKFEDHRLSGGPGKVCTCLGIEKSEDGTVYHSENAVVQIFERPADWICDDIYAGPRVGMSARVADYANKAWRFYPRQNTFVSRPRDIRYSF